LLCLQSPIQAPVFQDISLGIEVSFRSFKAADRVACDTLLKVFIMTAATYFLSDCLCEYDTKKSLQVSYPVTQLPSTQLPCTQLPFTQLPFTQLPVTTYPVALVMCFGQ